MPTSTSIPQDKDTSYPTETPTVNSSDHRQSGYGQDRNLGSRDDVLDRFPPYFNDPSLPNDFVNQVHDALTQFQALKYPQPDCPVPLGNTFGAPDYSNVTEVELPDIGLSLPTVVSDLVDLFRGMSNSSHPLHQPNVIPQANKAAIIAALLSAASHQTFLEGEKAWNAARAEMETATMVAKLIDDWDTTVSGGLFTYGGSGSALYGIKYALSSVFSQPNSRSSGIRIDGKVLCSRQGHYAKLISTDWLGLGTDNVVDVAIDPESFEMDMADLESKMRDLRERGVPVIAVLCTMGTTDTFAIDPVDKVAQLIKKYPNQAPYGRAQIFCDAVIGWVFLTFARYDFNENVLNFCDEVKAKIQSSYEKMRTIKYADTIGIDFHKTGWATYTSSMFLVQDFATFKRVMSRAGSPYLQYRVPYAPCLYTLEVTRPSAPALSAWATMRYFGASGYHSLVGGGLEVTYYFRKVLAKEQSIVCCNAENNGFVTLFRMYPEGVDANAQYEKELSDNSDSTVEKLREHNDLQKKISQQMWAWLRSGKKVDGIYAPYTGITYNFRTTRYTPAPGREPEAINALKTHPLNVNATVETMDIVLRAFKIARSMVLNGVVLEAPQVPLPPPYGNWSGEIE